MTALFEAISDPHMTSACRSLSSCTRDELRGRVEAALERLRNSPEPGGGELADAILSEARLPVEVWGSLIDEIIDVESIHVAFALRTWARKLILTSDVCSASPPMGRTTALDDLSFVLQIECHLSEPVVDRALGLLLEDDGANWQHAVRFLYDRVNPTTSDAWRDVPLGRFLMWATFDEQQDDPFAGMTDGEILPALGVDPVPGIVMIAMIYELTNETPARYPTVIEAAASDPWNPHFWPSENGPCGRTRPVPGHGLVDGRPEVVHKPIDVRRLLRPLRRLHSDA